METVSDDDCTSDDTSIVDDVSRFASDDDITDTQIQQTIFSNIPSTMHPEPPPASHQYNGPRSKLALRTLRRQRRKRKKRKPRLRLQFDEYVGPAPVVSFDDDDDFNPIDTGTIDDTSQVSFDHYVNTINLNSVNFRDIITPPLLDIFGSLDPFDIIPDTSSICSFFLTQLFVFPI